MATQTKTPSTMTLAQMEAKVKSLTQNLATIEATIAKKLIGSAVVPQSFRLVARAYALTAIDILDSLSYSLQYLKAPFYTDFEQAGIKRGAIALFANESTLALLPVAEDLVRQANEKLAEADTLH